MKIKLLQSYPDESVAYRASGICIGKEGSEKGMKSALSQGHMSIIEHLPMTFEIRGISRACSHQLVRHRLASYSQESQRYVNYVDLLKNLFEEVGHIGWDGDFIYKNYSDSNNPERFYIVLSNYLVIKEEYKLNKNYLYNQAHTLCNSLDNYDEDLRSGVLAEDARNHLPQNFKTNIIMSCNARSFIEQCNERLCEQAQWEIRAMYEAMRETIKDVYPTVYSYAKPKCARCKETRPCSRKSLTKDEKIEYTKLRG